MIVQIWKGEKTTNVYLNGELVDTPNIGALGKFTSTINLTQYGNNTINKKFNIYKQY